MQIASIQEKSTEQRPLRPRASPDSITGRDGYIVCQALVYAIEVIAALPIEYQEWSNREDMKALLAAYTSKGKVKMLHEGVCHHLFHPSSPLQRNTDIDLIEPEDAR